MARPWLVPNYGQLTQIDIPGNIRADRQLDLQRAQLSQQRHAAARRDALAKQELDARVADQRARAGLGILKQQADIAKAQRKSQADAMKDMLDSAVNIYGANKGDADTIVDNLKSRVLQMEPQLGQQASQRLVAALNDPQGRKAILADLGGAWAQLEKKTKTTSGGPKGFSGDVEWVLPPGETRLDMAVQARPHKLGGLFTHTGEEASTWQNVTSKKNLVEEVREVAATTRAKKWEETRDENLKKARATKDSSFRMLNDINRVRTDLIKSGTKMGTGASLVGVMNGIKDLLNIPVPASDPRFAGTIIASAQNAFAAPLIEAQKGNLNTSEFKFITDSLPQLGQTVQGSAYLLEAMGYVEQYKNAYASFESELLGRDLSRAATNRELDKFRRNYVPNDLDTGLPVDDAAKNPKLRGNIFPPALAAKVRAAVAATASGKTIRWQDAFATGTTSSTPTTQQPSGGGLVDMESLMNELNQ